MLWFSPHQAYCRSALGVSGHRPARSANHSSVVRPAASRTSPKSKILDIAKINDASTREPVGAHSQGNEVVRAAILLDRLKFSPGEIGAAYTVNLSKAAMAFQSAAGLTATGNVDADTWTALNDKQVTNGEAQPGAQRGAQPGDAERAQGEPAGKQPNSQAHQAAPAPANAAIITYIITPEDVAGPFTKIPPASGRDSVTAHMLREAKLMHLNYASPLELLAEKFHSSPRLLVELNPRKTFKKAGEQIRVPNVLTPEPAAAASVMVDGANRSVTALDAQGKILAFYPATVGSEHDPLPVGDWKIQEISWYPKFKYNPNLFWDAENKTPRATIQPGPRNPVGVVWIGLSKPHYGIHGTPAPSKIGLTESHGCIRLTNWDAAELGKMVHVGAAVVLKNAAPADELTSATKVKPSRTAAKKPVRSSLH